MPTQDSAATIIVGGHSRIACALVARLGSDARCISRRATGRSCDLVVDDYTGIPAAAFAGARTVVNCVGIARGTPAELARVNVDVPTSVARMLRDTGDARLIHVSSFSVYGGARMIDAGTPVVPASDYGRSKLAADEALRALLPPERLALLRLPLIYSLDAPGKLGELMRIWARARVLPIPSGDIARAMIGVELSADVIAHLIDQPQPGVCFAADPRPFHYEDAKRARGERLITLPLPRGLTHAAIRLAPGIGERLFADSRLAEQDNLALHFGLPSRLYADIAALRLGSIK